MSANGRGSNLAHRRILLDCRWLGLGGTGRATELLLAELGELRPAGTWILWGPRPRVSELAFPGAAVVPTSSDPRSLFGQRDLLSVPRHEAAVYMNQIRPLRPGPAVMIVHDTIPLRYGGPLPVRLAKHVYIAVAARVASSVVTVSRFSQERIARDLRIPQRDIRVFSYPIDEARAGEIAALREQEPPSERLLYVGQFRRHKNLERLCLAFAGTAFARRGGRLLLVGGEPTDTARLRYWVERAGLDAVEARSICPEHVLRRLMATSRALIVPSLEEGYGLPAFEAAACGLPVAASRTGAMTELPADAIVFFDPWDVEDIARAIDEVVLREPVRRHVPRGEGYAAVVLEALESVLADTSGTR